MPACPQCTDPARCENFGVCQQFRHTLPAGSYEQRIKELAPELGMPRAMARADMEERESSKLPPHPDTDPREDRDIHSHMMIVATRASHAAGDVSHKAMLRAICRAIVADKNLMRKLAPEAPPCKPGTRCSRSIRGLGGCEAGSCEREEAAAGVNPSEGAQ